METIFDSVKKLGEEKDKNRFATPESFWPQLNENKSTDTKTNTQQNSATPNTQQPTATDQEIKNKTMNENCKPNRKLIVKTIQVAALAAAGTYPVIATFGNEYKKLIGYYFITTTLSGLTTTQVKLGISDSSRTILDPVLIDHHTVSTSVPVKDRLNKEECIDLVAGQVTVNVVTAAAVGGTALEVQMVALVEK